MRYVIIGNSAAGMAAAETLRRLDSDGKIVIVSEDRFPYSRSLTPYVVSGLVSEDRLGFRSKNLIAELAIEATISQAVSIDHQLSQVILADGEAIGYDKLLIATGASAIVPSIPGIDCQGVFPLRTAADANAIARAATGKARAVVIGGGLVGLLSAKALRELGLSVTVVEAMPHLLPQQLDPAAAQIVAQKFREHDLNIVIGQQVSAIAGEAGQVVGVALSDGSRFAAEVVIVGVGVRPNIAIAQASGIAVGQGIQVDSRLQTSAQNVYAAGDVAETEDFLTGQRIVSGTWIAATEQGKVAAYNMAGVVREYEGALSVQNAADFFGLPVVSVGLVNPPDDTYETLLLRRPARRLYKKLVLKDDVVKGMICVGDIARAGVITALIRSKACVTGFKDRLLSEQFGGVPVGAHLSRQPELSNYV